MNILVTGSNGFIGNSLITALMRHHTVSGQGRQSNKNKLGIQEYFELNINGQSDWGACLQKVDAIIHLAAVAHNNSKEPNYINEVNVKGTINLALQAVEAGVKRFVFISSIGVLGNKTAKPFNEKSSAEPHSLYAESKLQAERELLKIAGESELEVVIIRPVLVYGEGAPGNFGKLVQLVQKTPLLPFALCHNKRSFISVDNLVDFISVCITHPKAKNEIFCISDGTDVSIREFTDGIAMSLNKGLMQLPIPISIFKLLGKITGKGEEIDQLIGDLQVDSSKARELLGWIPPVTMAETFSKLTNNK
ncbi:MAG: nucleoside-diphosphate-sugar epimerase [Oleiphilaceae bacterium]|jgi:nucleoside-diphosphate-sugar epimerase